MTFNPPLLAGFLFVTGQAAEIFGCQQTVR